MACVSSFLVFTDAVVLFNGYRVTSKNHDINIYLNIATYRQNGQP